MEKEIKVLKEDIEKTIELKKEDIGEIPAGTMNITENGIYNVGSYASADVQVPGIVPSGTLDITSNNTYDVTQYASANVNVPQPSGSIFITTNGETDVTQYATANVNVPGLSEINDGSYLFYSGARVNKKTELLGILKKPVDTKYMFSYMYYTSGSGNNNLFDISNIDFSLNTDMSGMFSYNNYGKLSNFNGIQSMNTSNVTNMTNCFLSLQQNGTSDIDSDYTFDLSSWNTSNVTTMQNMFSGFLGNFKTAYTLTIDLHGWNVTNVQYMTSMFSGCKVKVIDLTGWNPANCLNFDTMFNNTNLIEIDLSSFENTKSGTAKQMFYNGRTITKIDMRKFDFTKLTSYTNMFGSSANNGPANDCLIIVKDATQKQWINTNFSRLTNVKTVAEL